MGNNVGVVKAKKFVNDNGSRIVEECIESLTMMHAGSLRQIKDVNAVVDVAFREKKNDRVAVISGGGSGHEPAHAGFVGDKMLTAAVCGNIFASPSVEQIVKTILTVAGNKGCLLIVKNYTGDRLSFGLAAEKAKLHGIQVDLVFVQDDAALVGKGVTGARGLAGTVFVHKITGAFAASGAKLSDVKKTAQLVSNNVKTINVALTSCSLPGKEQSTRLTSFDRKMEVGLGIHNEPGKELLELMETNPLVERLVGDLLSSFEKRPEKVAVLVNNLGGTTNLEIYGICLSVNKELKKRSISIERFYCGPLMTSLEMAGFSLALFRIDDEPARIVNLLDEPVGAPGWTQVFSFNGTIPEPIEPFLPSNDEENRIAHSWALNDECASKLGRQIRAGAKKLIEKEAFLTNLDKKVGDGDAGHTFRVGASSVLKALDNGEFELNKPARVLRKLTTLAETMGGSSGAVLAIFFSAMEIAILKNSSVGQAVQEGTNAITMYGGAEKGMRTMLDALIPLSGFPPSTDLKILAKNSMDAANSTAKMKAFAGRSNYVPEHHLTVPDPGAMAVALALEAFANTK